ncbi:hypothetical protein GIB67_023318, partial [Kingdonia uniflora]
YGSFKVVNAKEVDAATVIKRMRAALDAGVENVTMYTMNEKVPPTTSNRRKKESIREGDQVLYKRKIKTIDPSTVVPPNTVDSANEGASEALPPTESVEGVNIPQGSEFKTESTQASLGAQPPLPNVSPNFDVNISIVGGYSEVGLPADGDITVIGGTWGFPTILEGTDISTRYLVLFAKDKVAKKWSWGSEVLAHMYFNLGATSRDDGKQFAYCTTLLESWIFVHFPKLVGIPKEIDSNAYEHCTCWKWDVSVTNRYGGTTLLNFREALDNYKLEDVVWDPYRDKKDSSLAFKEVTFFYGALASPDHVQPYYPNRVVRQFNQEQGIPTKRLLTEHHEYASLSPNVNLNDQQITTLNDHLQKLKEDKEKESEANINLREALKEKTSKCDMLKETIEQMKVEIELKRVVDEQCTLEFADLPMQLDANVRYWSTKIWRKKNTSLEAELRQKSSLEDCNQRLSVELNKKCKETESLKVVNAILMEQIDMQLPPATPLVALQSHQPVPDTTLAKKYDDLLATHEDVKNKLIAKEDFRQKLVNAEERMKFLKTNNIEWHKKLVNSEKRKKTLEVDNNEWEVWRQALKKALATEGMRDMGDPTFEELFEQNKRFFTIARQ